MHISSALSMIRGFGNKVMKRLLEPSNLQFKILLKQKGYSMSPHRPIAPWMNKILKERSEVEDSLSELRRIGLLPHSDPPKNWDALAALDFILNQTDKRSRVLDAGGEIYSPLVEWLFLYGYRFLHVINLCFDRDFNRGSIHYTRGDCTATSYPSDYFDVVTCLSVIEHGVDLKDFLKESYRILRLGGYLIVSTDYWMEPINSAGKKAYGAPIKIFTQKEIQEFITLAKSKGFVLMSELNFSVGSKVVHWKRYELDYTFICFALKKGYYNSNTIAVSAP